MSNAANSSTWFGPPVGGSATITGYGSDSTGGSAWVTTTFPTITTGGPANPYSYTVQPWALYQTVQNSTWPTVVSEVDLDIPMVDFTDDPEIAEAVTRWQRYFET